MPNAAPIIDDEDTLGDELAPIDFTASPAAGTPPAPGGADAAPPANVAPAAAPAQAPVPTDLPAIPAAAPMPVFAPQVIPGGGAAKVTSAKMDPREGQNIVAADVDLRKREQAAKEQEGLVKQRQAEEAARAQAQAAEAAKQHAIFQQQIIDDHNARLNAAMAQRDAAYNEWKNAKYENYWQNKPEGDRVLARLSLIFGGVLQGATGASQNSAMAALQQQVDADFRRQQLEIDKKHDQYVARGHDLETVQASKRDALADLTLKKAAALDAIAEQGKAMQMRQGVPAQQAATNAAVLELERKSLDLRREVAKDTTAQVETDTGRKIQSLKVAGGAGKGKLSILYEEAAKPGATSAPLIKLAETLGLGKNDRERAALVMDALKDPRSIEAIKRKEEAGGGGLASVRQNAVFADLAEAQQAVKESTPGAVSPDDIAKIKTNELRSEGSEKALKEGGVTSLLERGLRRVGASPTSKFSGLPPEVQKQYSLAEKMVMHLAELQPSKGVEIQRQIYDRYFPYLPGLSRDEISRREQALRDAVVSQTAIQDRKNRSAAGRTAVENQPKAAPGGKKYSDAAIAQARAAKGDPDAPASVKAAAAKILATIGE